MKKVGGKGGSANYSDSELKALLDVMEESDPLGNKDWALVLTKYNEYAHEKERLLREKDGLKTKLDKLVQLKKPTVCAVCPLEVRSVKDISRGMKIKVSALVLGIPMNDEEEAEGG